MTAAVLIAYMTGWFSGAVGAVVAVKALAAHHEELRRTLNWENERLREELRSVSRALAYEREKKGDA